MPHVFFNWNNYLRMVQYKVQFQKDNFLQVNGVSFKSWRLLLMRVSRYFSSKLMYKGLELSPNVQKVRHLQLKQSDNGIKNKLPSKPELLPLHHHKPLFCGLCERQDEHLTDTTDFHPPFHQADLHGSMEGKAMMNLSTVSCREII